MKKQKNRFYFSNLSKFNSDLELFKDLINLDLEVDCKDMSKNLDFSNMSPEPITKIGKKN
ncbi:hypothetical protein BpHYR1_019951 [Brachionus plicatilis]|uniref:Uncharacterized protein n=1 Tax=Brachionus plicatilis TaxID=10195 RepID=A0A3M7S695_BRAPC|nr:hypothetical protein BpHYR1_019951 [Brachionus plicatilis]